MAHPYKGWNISEENHNYWESGIPSTVVALSQCFRTVGKWSLI